MGDVGDDDDADGRALLGLAFSLPEDVEAFQLRLTDLLATEALVAAIADPSALWTTLCWQISCGGDGLRARTLVLAARMVRIRGTPGHAHVRNKIDFNLRFKVSNDCFRSLIASSVTCLRWRWSSARRARSSRPTSLPAWMSASKRSSPRLGRIKQSRRSKPNSLRTSQHSSGTRLEEIQSINHHVSSVKTKKGLNVIVFSTKAVPGDLLQTLSECFSFACRSGIDIANDTLAFVARHLAADTVEAVAGVVFFQLSPAVEKLKNETAEAQRGSKRKGLAKW